MLPLRRIAHNNNRQKSESLLLPSIQYVVNSKLGGILSCFNLIEKGYIRGVGGGHDLNGTNAIL